VKVRRNQLCNQLTDQLSAAILDFLAMAVLSTWQFQLISSFLTVVCCCEELFINKSTATLAIPSYF